MLSQPFLYQNTKYSDSETAVIVVPDIYGMTRFNNVFTDRAVEEFKVLGFALDYFYEITGKQTSLDYTEGREYGIKLMSEMTGQDFMRIFNKTLNIILEHYPNIHRIIVCGFCFGGRLAMLSGVNSKVNSIISFYGTGQNKQFYNGKTTLESLVQARKGDNLKILALYGALDETISEQDRVLTNQILIVENSFSYTERVYHADHAFFNSDKNSYDKEAAMNAWEEIKKFLN